MSNTLWFQDLPWSEISFYANRYSLQPDWVAAMIMTESGNNEYAARYEPAYKYLVNPKDFADKLGITVETETMMQKTSFGLVQIMGGLARGQGFSGHIPQLTEIPLNLDLGCKFLKKKLEKYGDIHSAIAAYNAGSVRKTPGGMFENQKHVDRFDQWLRKLQAK